MRIVNEGTLGERDDIRIELTHDEARVMLAMSERHHKEFYNATAHRLTVGLKDRIANPGVWESGDE